jgi:hypothetical protein
MVTAKAMSRYAAAQSNALFDYMKRRIYGCRGWRKLLKVNGS